jgi:hypothetical protein
MKRLAKGTLYDIARHTDKTLKMVELMAHAEYPLMISKIGAIDSQSDAVLALEAFHSDLTKTVGMIEKAHMLLSTVDNDGDVVRLKGEDKNLIKLFGSHYDHDNLLLTLKHYEINLGRDFNAEQCRQQLLHNILELPDDDYQLLYKNRKKLFSLQKDQLNNDEDKVRFLSTIKEAEDHNKIIETIYSMADNFTAYRQSLPLDYKNMLDRDVTFERSMIDSVLQTSTYITKEKGIEQVAPAHKKQMDEVKLLAAIVEKHDFLYGVEVDQDASIMAMIDAFGESNKNTYNLSNGVLVKARKLGNYGVRGMYIDGHKIAAMDIKDPNALVHELVHAVDFSDNNRSKPQRRAAAAMMGSRLNQDTLVDKYGKKFAAYILSDVEVIARGGEIAYLLMKHDYQSTEPFDDFVQRVQAEEAISDKNGDDFIYVKKIDYYQSLPEIYFDFANAPSHFLNDMKTFYESYLNYDGRDITPIDTQIIDRKKYGKDTNNEVILGRARYEPKSVAMFNPENIGFALTYNQEHQIVDTAVIIDDIIKHVTHIGRSNNQYKGETVCIQENTIKALTEFLQKQDDPYLHAQVIKSLHEVLNNWHGRIDRKSVEVLGAMLNEGKTFNTAEIYFKHLPHIDISRARTIDLKTEMQGYVDDKDYMAQPYEDRRELSKANDNWNISKKETKELVRAMNDEVYAYTQKELPVFAQRRDLELDYYYHSTKGTSRFTGEYDGDGKRIKRMSYSVSTVMNDSHKNKLQPLIDMAEVVLNRHNVEETLAYLTANDNVTIALITDNAVMGAIKEENRETFYKKFASLSFDNGVFDQLMFTKHLISKEANTHWNDFTTKFASHTGKDLLAPFTFEGRENQLDLYKGLLTGEVKLSDLRRGMEDSSSLYINAQMRSTRLQTPVQPTIKAVVEAPIVEAIKTTIEKPKKVDSTKSLLAHLSNGESGIIDTNKNAATLKQQQIDKKAKRSKGSSGQGSLF